MIKHIRQPKYEVNMIDKWHFCNNEPADGTNKILVADGYHQEVVEAYYKPSTGTYHYWCTDEQIRQPLAWMRTPTFNFKAYFSLQDDPAKDS